ncbi:small acid-soluble spore protein O [Bacillus cereus]
MGKRKANHTISGMNAASAQGQGAGYNEEFANEPLTPAERQNNKKRKKESVTKNPKRFIFLLGFFLMFIT